MLHLHATHVNILMVFTATPLFAYVFALLYPWSNIVSVCLCKYVHALNSGFSYLCALMSAVNLRAHVELYPAPLCVSG